MTNEVATTDVVLRDGSTVCVRPTEERDVAALLQFLQSLSPQSLYYRFLSVSSPTMDRVRRLATLDGAAGTSLVVESAGHIVAFASFYRDPRISDRAEVAFAVARSGDSRLREPPRHRDFELRFRRQQAGRVRERPHPVLGRRPENVGDPVGPDMTAVVVQRMAPEGIEMIVGATQDPLFGPLIACGTGGVLVDVLADTAFRLHPLDVSDAREMIDQLRGARLLCGYRGARPADEAALRDVLLRVSAMVSEAPEIQELDLNPVVVLPSGACVVDARLRVERTPRTRRGRRVE